MLVVPVALSGQDRDVSPAGSRYALLIGASKYDSDQLRDLPFTENDVTELAQVLRARGYRAQDVILLTEGIGAEIPRYRPGVANIRKEMRALLHRCRPPDMVLVALTGHGLQFRGHMEQYFLPCDANLEDAASFLSLTELYEDLAGCAAGYKLLLVDACRVDAMDETALGTIGGRGTDRRTRPGPPIPRCCTAAFFSCSRGQASFDHDDLKHGVFFHFVIEGLRGAAADRVCRVTLPSLQDYVSRRVSDYVRAKYKFANQVPERFGCWPATVSLVPQDRSTPHREGRTINKIQDDAPAHPEEEGNHSVDLRGRVGTPLWRVASHSGEIGAEFAARVGQKSRPGRDLE